VSIYTEQCAECGKRHTWRAALDWLVNCSPHDLNWKSALARANSRALHQALLHKGLSKRARARIEARLRALERIRSRAKEAAA
jgi:hypothetical protein